MVHSEWFSIIERLPEWSGKYLVICPTADPTLPYITLAWFSVPNQKWEIIPTIFKVAYWMHIPELPEEYQ